MGGTCLNRGCIPSKVMITTAELLQKIKKADAFGIDVEGSVRLNMQRLMERKNTVIQSQTKGILDLLKHHNIRYLKGTGYIKGKGLTAVRLSNRETQEVPWDKLILATGTRPFSLPSLGFDGHTILSSNDALCLQEVPESILIAEGTLAMKTGARVQDLADTIHAHPTLAEIMLENCLKALDRSLHA